MFDERSAHSAPEGVWIDYADHAHHGHSVVGTVKRMEKVHSPQLGNARDLLVYLPPSYATSERRFPVLYMHDGQNLFDNATSFSGEWDVDATMEAMGARGMEAIVVAIPNMGVDRLDEYSPFVDRRGGGRGDAYVDYLVQTVKPLVDRDFRTQPGRRHTGIAGSSMGGLISLYAFFREPEVFGFAGVMSPALWFAERAIFRYVTDAPFVGGTVYLDIGSAEGADAVHDARRMQELLMGKGYAKGRDLVFIVETGGRHEEAAWARRMRKQLTLWLDAAEPNAAPNGAPNGEGAGV
jgi:predicted alpha/beta superfamily hydrolase